MASRGCLFLVRQRPLSSTAILHARPFCLSSSIIRPLPISSPSHRAFCQSTSRLRRLDPSENPKVDYDPSLGDPWYPHRLRNAKPLTSHTVGSFLRLPSTRAIVVLAAAAAVLYYYSHLEVVPVSGRTRFNCYSDESMRRLGEVQYQVMLASMEDRGEHLMPQSALTMRMVKRVLARLVQVAGPAAGDEDWVVNVILNDNLQNANAFVLPGGKVFVYSGMLRIANTEGQLAAVLGHEIAHNLAKHASERCSSAQGNNIFLGGLLLALASTPLGLMFGYFLGEAVLHQLFNTPMSRMQESEADYIGLMLMAEACYDPREAIAFWKRLDEVHTHLGSNQPPEFLSTHPSNQHRIEKLTKWLPEALKKREESDCKGTQGFAEMFRRAMERSEVWVVGV